MAARAVGAVAYPAVAEVAPQCRRGESEATGPRVSLPEMRVDKVRGRRAAAVQVAQVEARRAAAKAVAAPTAGAPVASRGRPVAEAVVRLVGLPVEVGRAVLGAVATPPWSLAVAAASDAAQEVARQPTPRITPQGPFRAALGVILVSEAEAATR